MGFFDRFSGKVSPAGRTAANRTEDTPEIAELNHQIAGNNSQIDRLYREIGELYCELRGERPEPELAGQVSSIRELRAENETLEARIQDLRGLTRCPDCGTVIPKNLPYCTGCGRRTLPENVTVCPGCGSVIPRGTPFCSQCGTRLPEAPVKGETLPVKYCDACGAVLAEGSFFYSACGARAPGADSAPGDTAPSAEPDRRERKRELPPAFPPDPVPWSMSEAPTADLPEPEELPEAPAEEAPEPVSQTPDNARFRPEPPSPPRDTDAVEPEPERCSAEPPVSRPEPEPSEPVPFPPFFTEPVSTQVPEPPADPAPEDAGAAQPDSGDRCPNCGTLIGADELFCYECGTRIR